MKKLRIFLVMIALVLACTSAFAMETTGQGSMVARNAELAAFTDGNGYIFVSGLSTPVNTTRAESILHIDAHRIVFFAKADAAAGIPEGRLISLKLDGFVETVVTNDVYAACCVEDSIYYISNSSRSQLMRYDLDTRITRVAYFGAEDLQRVYSTENGIVVTLVENAGAYIQSEVLGSFIAYDGEIAAEVASYDDFDIYLTDSTTLYIQETNATQPIMIDTSVQDWAIIDDTVYYIVLGQGMDLILKSYDTVNALWNVVLNASTDMEAQLTASENSLFMLSKENVIYSVDVRNGKLVSFATLPALSSYNLGAGKTLDGYKIEAVSGQLNVYGTINDSSTLPTFTFVDYSSQVVADTSSDIRLLSAYAISGESTVWDLLQPAPQYSTLRRGSRGEAVSAIQQPLLELGYYDYDIDGIFGWRTERAIQLLQADLGLTVNGVADESLQRMILGGSLSDYDPYKTLSRGASGLRVLDLQNRLRDLGFLADEADGIYGPRTQAAVELFQMENNLKVSGAADANTLQRLYSNSVSPCASYIDLQRGDTGYRVNELNQRLKDLYYLEGSVGSTYTSKTYEAVKRFQQEAGLAQNGTASSAVQQRLFSRYAPENSEYITLSRGDDNSRVKQMQQRLVELKYFSGSCTGYFGRVTEDAVKMFQRAIDVEVTGKADPDTLRILFSKNAPEYKAPEKVKAPIIELSAYSKHENGMYYIADSVTTNGGVTVSWYAEGDVASYDIRITDDRNTIYTNDTGVSVDRTIASIPVTSLDPDRTYTITITAHPEDSKNDTAKTSVVKFVRVIEQQPDDDEIGTIGKLIITPVGNDISRENGVYQIPGSRLYFNWSADGSVRGYAYSFTDPNGTVIKGNNAIENVKEASIDAGSLRKGSVYTLTVYAVPTNGTMEHASYDSIRFAMKEEVSLPTAAPTAEPTAAPTAVPSVDMPRIQLSAITGAFETKVDGQYVTVNTISEGDISLKWSAGGDVASYNVQILHNGKAIVSQDFGANTTEVGFHSNNMTPDAIYELKVTAYAADPNFKAVATMYFMRPGAAATEAPVVTEAPTQKPTEAPTAVPTEVPTAVPTEVPTAVPTEAPTEAPVVTEAPTKAPSVDMPRLRISTVTGTFEASVNGQYVTVNTIAEGDIALMWSADGDVEFYNVQILDGDKAMVSQDFGANTTEVGFNSSNMTPGTIYELRVTAYAADPSIRAAASMYFQLPAPVVTEAPTAEPTEEPTPEPTEEPTPEPTEEPTPEPTEEPTPEPTEEPTPEPTAEPTPEPTEEPTPEPTEEPKKEYPMDDPKAWTEDITEESDEEAIAVIQLRLVEWLWLKEDSYEEGKLDEPTIQAIINFQQNVSLFQLMNVKPELLMENNLDKPIICAQTFQFLFTDSNVIFENPNPLF